MRNISEEVKQDINSLTPDKISEVEKAICSHCVGIIEIPYDKLQYAYSQLVAVGLDKDKVFWNYNRHIGKMYIDNCRFVGNPISTILKICQIFLYIDQSLFNVLQYLNEQAKNFYWLDTYEVKNGEIIAHPPHNKELREGVIGLGSNKLDDIVNHFYRSSSTFQDKKNALQNLYQNHIKASKFNIGLISDDAKAFYKTFNYFVEVRCKHAEEKISRDNAKIKKPDEKEVQVFFDIGLAIVRLIKIYENRN